jgi:peptide/nickel transport system substrate-binding protein
MKTRTLWMACLIVAALVLATSPLTASAEEPKYGGTITRSVAAGPISWDIAAANWSASWWGGTHLEKLLNGDVDRAREKGMFISRYHPYSAVRGQLAEDWGWRDANTVYFKLREGIRFHNKPPVNGRELDAKDVVESLKRTWEVPRFKKGYWNWMESITAVDKYTVEIKTNRFDVQWWAYPGEWWYNEIYPRELVEKKLMNNWKFANGTGPWILKEYITDVGGTWVRNPDYWDKGRIGGKEYKLPFADKMRKLIIPDAATYMAAFRTGKLDFLPFLDKEKGDEIMKTTKGVVSKKILTRAAVETVIFNVERKPLDNKKVRKALMMAIDYQNMLDSLWGGDGVIPMTFITNPYWAEGAPEHKAKEMPADVVEAHTLNLEKAKALMAEAGYPKGFKTSVLIESLERDIDTASLLAGYWKKLGVDLQIKTVETASHQSLILAHDYDITFYGWGADPPISVLSQTTPENMRNLSRWVDPHYTKLLRALLIERDNDKLNALIREADIYQAQSYTIFTPVYPNATSVWWPWVKNYGGESNCSIFSDAPLMARIWIDQALKKKMGR